MKFPKPGKKKLLLEKFGKRVSSQQFIMPDGASLDYIFFQVANPVMVFPVTEEGHVVALKQFRFGANAVVIEVPGGNPSKKGETDEATAVKELAEETGYVCKKLIKLNNNIWFEPANYRCHYSSFLALGCKREEKQKLDDSELVEVFEVPLKEWVAMITNGEITDLKTIATTFFALPHLGYSVSKIEG